MSIYTCDGRPATHRRAPRGPAPLTDEEKRDLGLMAHWRFCRAPIEAGLRCWLCRDEALFVTQPDAGDRHPMAWCLRHARNF